MMRIGALLVLPALFGCSTKDGMSEPSGAGRAGGAPFSFELGDRVRSNEAVFLSARIESNELILSCAPNRDKRLEPKELTFSCNLLGEEFVAPFQKASLVEGKDGPVFGSDAEHFGIIMYDATHGTPGRIRKLPISVKVEFK